jgi:hypothetical protein
VTCAKERGDLFLHGLKAEIAAFTGENERLGAEVVTASASLQSLSGRVESCQHVVLQQV